MEAADLFRHDCLRIKTPGSRPATWNLTHPDDATLYAAMPSRRFIPRRPQVFLDHLTRETRANVAKVMST